RRPTPDRDGRASKRPARGLAARGGMPPRYPRLASGAMASDHDQWTVADTASGKSGRVQVFPNRESVLALYGEVLLDIDPPQRGPVVDRGTHSRRQASGGASSSSRYRRRSSVRPAGLLPLSPPLCRCRSVSSSTRFPPART